MYQESLHVHVTHCTLYLKEKKTKESKQKQNLKTTKFLG